MGIRTDEPSLGGEGGVHAGKQPENGDIADNQFIISVTLRKIRQNDQLFSVRTIYRQTKV